MSTSALTCVVLAGGPRDAVAALDANAPNKAFLPIAGRTLVERTLDALVNSPNIGRIIVVAPPSAHAHPALAQAHERRPDGAQISNSLHSGLQGLPGDELIVVAASDLPILSVAAVDEFVALARAANADAVYSCLEQRSHVERFPDVPHTWARLREGTYCGGGLVALRPRLLPALDRFLERLGAARKNPLALASIFGWDILARYALGQLSVRQAEERASKLLGAPARAAICTHPEVAVNVDRVDDVERALRL
ncbi:MAG TPA: NTP transferase domain-containing protein [Candidatus Baltobacteraceae bacterium]